MKTKSLFKKYWPLIIFPLGVILDFVTKQLALHNLENNPIVIIKNFFKLELVFNQGAAWGMALPKFFLVSISLIASVGFLIYFFKCKAGLWTKISAVIVATGSFGNLIDRAFYEFGVIDFLSFTFGKYPFPVFNVADCFVVVGIISLLLAAIFEDKIHGISSK